MKNNWKEMTLKEFLDKIKNILFMISNILFLSVFIVLFYASLSYVLNNISNETAKNILEYIRVLIWPLIVFICILIFKKNISKRIDNIKECKAPGGIEFKMESNQLRSQEENDLSSDNKDYLKIDSPQFNIILQEKEEQINNLKESADQLKDRLARTEIELDFEKIYNYIFSSQIELLYRINNFNNISLEFAAEYFQNIRNANSPIFDQWNVNKYLEYLSAVGLINISGTHFEISEKGKVFLMYLTKQNYKKNGL